MFTCCSCQKPITVVTDAACRSETWPETTENSSAAIVKFWEKKSFTKLEAAKLQGKGTITSWCWILIWIKTEFKICYKGSKKSDDQLARMKMRIRSGRREPELESKPKLSTAEEAWQKGSNHHGEQKLQAQRRWNNDCKIPGCDKRDQLPKTILKAPVSSICFFVEFFWLISFWLTYSIKI